MAETQDKNGEIKPVGRLTGKRKKDFGKWRKKHEKRQDSSITSTGANALEDGEDEESSDLPTAVSSTSGSESMAKAILKEMKLTKRTTAKKPPNFAKIVKSFNAAPFVFQKRLSRMDWRKIHTIDVDRVIREVDLDALESAVETIIFGDIQGEDTRNFSEANIMKVFRLAQLMVEYLLHVQELLASHQDTLLATGAEMQRRVEKQRLKHAKLISDLSTLRHNLKQAKKSEKADDPSSQENVILQTIRTYEIMLRVHNKLQHRQQKLHQTERKQQLQAQQSVEAQTVRCCPLCDKLFESAYYLDLHVARRHPKSNEMPEDAISAAVFKAEEAIAARAWEASSEEQFWQDKVRAETTAALQARIKHSQEIAQADLQRAQSVAEAQVSSLEASLRESNKLLEVQSQLHLQAARKGTSSPENEKKDDKTPQRLKDFDDKLQSLEAEVKRLKQENSNLMKDLTYVHAEAIHKQIIAMGRNEGAEDLHAKSGNWKHGRAASVERRTAKERRKCNQYLSTSPERSESERMPKPYGETLSNRSSAPERKRKQNWEQNLSRTSSAPEKIDRISTVPVHDPSPPARHRAYKSEEESHFYDPAIVHISQQYRQWKTLLRKKQEGVMSPEKFRPSSPSGSRTPASETMSPKSEAGKSPKRANNTLVTAKMEIAHDLETGVQPLLEARFQDVSETTLVLAKAQVEEDLVRAAVAEENRVLNDDGGKVANKIAIFETKVGLKKMMKEDVQGIRLSEEAVPRLKEKLEEKKKRSADEIIEEEARRRAEIADAATMDVGEDQPLIPPSDKEKWLEEHPYKPIPQRPHVLSKYPHPPDVFSTTRDELAHHLDEQLGGELKKFGFGSDTAAISDSVYDAAKAVLDKQHKARVSNLHQTHKRSLEYERGAILWQTQRAIHDRDLEIIEGQFEAESDNSSEESSSPSPRSNSADESDDSSTKRRGPPLSQRETKGVWLGKSTSPVIKSPQTSRSSTIESPKVRSPVSPHLKGIDEQVIRETHIATIFQRLTSAPGHKDHRGRDGKPFARSSVKVHSPPRNQVVRFKGGNKQSPPQSPTYLFPAVAKFKRAEESSQHNKYDEHQSDTFGLGEWNSDDETPPATEPRDKGKGPQAEHQKYPKSSKKLTDANSNDDSEESKIFQELDAEIDEIIRL